MLVFEFKQPVNLIESQWLGSLAGALHLEDLLQSLLKHIDVMINQERLIKVLLLYDANQHQEVPDLLEIEGFPGVEPDNRLRFVVLLKFFGLPVDEGDIEEDVDHVGADREALDFNGLAVG